MMHHRQLRVALLGPCSPADVADLLRESDAVRAGAVLGYRGIPVSDLARGLVGAGIHVDVLTHAPGASQPQRFEGPGFSISLVPQRAPAMRMALDGFHKERGLMANLLESLPATVVHAHWTYEFATLALADGRPALVTAHDDPWTIMRHLPGPYRVARYAQARAVARRVRQLVCVSPYLERAWRQNMHYRGNVRVIPNGVPPLPFPTGTATAIAHTFAAVGDSSRRKNVKTLLASFDLVTREVPGATLALVGNGLDSQGDLASWARRHGVATGVSFLGRVDRDELSGILRRTQILVHPSLEESQGLAVIEAMSLGIPVIGGASSGAVPWVLDSGRAGMLTDVRHPRPMAAAMVELMRSEAARRRLGHLGMRRAREAFSPSRTRADYVECYDELARSS